jgi:hypothetical protein
VEVDLSVVLSFSALLVVEKASVHTMRGQGGIGPENRMALKKDGSFRTKRLPDGREDVRMRLDHVRVVSRRGDQLLHGRKRRATLRG